MPNIVLTLKTMSRKLWDFLLGDKPVFVRGVGVWFVLFCLTVYVDYLLIGTQFGVAGSYLILALALALYVFCGFRTFVWLRNAKKSFGDYVRDEDFIGFYRDVGLRFWIRGFQKRAAEWRIKKFKRRIETSKTPANYLLPRHTLSWQFNKLKRKLDGSVKEDARWDLTFECAYQLRQGLEEWWNGDRSQTKVVDWRDDVTLCIIVGPHRIQAAMALMSDYQAFLALDDERIGKLLEQRFGLDTTSFHQIPINDGATCFLRVSDHPRRHLPPGGRKTRNPILPNLNPLGEVR